MTWKSHFENMTDDQLKNTASGIATEALSAVKNGKPFTYFTAADLASAILKARKAGTYDPHGESHYDPENSPEGIAAKVNAAAKQQKNPELTPDLVAKIAELAENTPA